MCSCPVQPSSQPNNQPFALKPSNDVGLWAKTQNTLERRLRTELSTFSSGAGSLTGWSLFCLFSTFAATWLLLFAYVSEDVKYPNN